MTTMNVYQVVSEELETRSMAWDPPESPEYGCWVELVVAENGAKAKYMAFKENVKYAHPDMGDMPKMSVRIVGHPMFDVRRDEVSRIVTHDAEYQHLWSMFRYPKLDEMDGLVDICDRCDSDVSRADRQILPYDTALCLECFNHDRSSEHSEVFG